jgi:hypothetical protein
MIFTKLIHGTFTADDIDNRSERINQLPVDIKVKWAWMCADDVTANNDQELKASVDVAAAVDVAASYATNAAARHASYAAIAACATGHAPGHGAAFNANYYEKLTLYASWLNKLIDEYDIH